MKNILSLLGLAFLLFSCAKEGKLDDNQDQLSFSPPEIIELATLTDSIKPESLRLNTFPAPRVIQVPQRDGGTYSFEDESGEIQTFQLLAPSRQDLLVLKNEAGEIVKNPNGNPYLLGKGGISQFRTFSTDDGLALDAVNTAILDSRGHLWFGTNGGGISRYDGSNFTNYSTSQGLTDKTVRTMMEDSKGNIWIGTINGVSRFDGFSFKNFTTADGLANDFVFGIVEDHAGNLWFGTGGGGISKFDGTTFTNYTTEQGLADNFVIAVTKDSKGNLYFGTNGGGMSRFDGSTFTNYTESEGLAGNRVRSFALGSDGILWIGTIGGGISRFDGARFQNFTTKDGLADNIVRAILEDSNGNIWFGTGNGTSRFDGEEFTTYTRDQGMPANSILAIASDKSGKLWFATDGGGISRFDGSPFTSFTVNQGLGGNIVMSTLEDRNGNLWFGTNGGGVSVFDGLGFTTYSISQGLGGDFIYSLVEDQNGDIWMGTAGRGFSKFDGKSFTTYTSAQGLPSNEILSIVKDLKGNLWLGTENGLSKFDGASFTNFGPEQGLAGYAVLKILTEDADKGIWIATADGGLSFFDGKKFTNLSIKQGLADNAVLSLAKDRQGNLWIGTGNGLSVLPDSLRKAITENQPIEQNPFYTFRTENGLPNNVILQIVPMSNGKIAIGTNLGIAVFNSPYSVISDFSLENIEIFNSNTGYPVKDLTDGQNGMYQDSKGILWAGTGSNKTALVRFDYEALLRNKEKPEIFIKQLRINEEEISWESLQTEENSIHRKSSEQSVFGQELTSQERDPIRERFKGLQFDETSPFYPIPQGLVLPYKHNHINIDFGSNELAKPFLVEYQYILEGYDEEWSPVLKKTSATFGNIHEGEYTFLVRARFTGSTEGTAGDWTEPLAYSFKVLPPVYRTWWAYLTYTLIFLSFAYPIHRYQRNKAIKQEQEKARERELEQAREIEKAYTKLESAHENLKSTQAQLIQQEKLASLGQLTAGIAHEIKNPLNFVNNFSGLSLEFLEEVEEELDKLEESEPLENARDLLGDIKINLTKIKHHGGRADGIVKSMLMHSRGGSGSMEPSDVNEVIKEYVNLSFHGMRANKNPINVELSLDLDESLPKIPLNTEDFSRVILNLTKNAFDAMREKIAKAGPDYKAKLEVRSKNLGDKILIEVEDNGPGVPDDIKDKLLMPFFTTKKGTEGTGLGLSITHDIIKAHNGMLDITTQVGEWTKFIIILPN
ncbi:MAG: two-component regulator propeller domain-containing protein [Algoriphagus sp.]|uniref:sensor histidine kinase n=1 Tax=Algoriphagus sp. TaxID=1872435 RepID=UPI00272EF19D|nr:sensor histidine kinase [Algoriphagus sp.]MDP2041894.1 two-component regulator propeller domain-containing protein [Algoriphagus sp.]MDP3474005.1 two-component regulator propeller domain-containing protein [Algoriphagus sp.]